MVLLSAEVTGPSSCAETFESAKRRKVDKDIAPSQDESTKTAAALPILDLAWRNENLYTSARNFIFTLSPVFFHVFDVESLACFLCVCHNLHECA